jgi:hypothetical protein
MEPAARPELHAGRARYSRRSRPAREKALSDHVREKATVLALLERVATHSPRSVRAKRPKITPRSVGWSLICCVTFGSGKVRSPANGSRAYRGRSRRSPRPWRYLSLGRQTFFSPAPCGTFPAVQECPRPHTSTLQCLVTQGSLFSAGCTVVYLHIYNTRIGEVIRS